MQKTWICRCHNRPNQAVPRKPPPPRHPNIIAKLVVMAVATEERIDYIAKQLYLLQASEAKLFHREANGLDATELLELVAKWVTLK